MVGQVDVGPVHRQGREGIEVTGLLPDQIHAMIVHVMLLARAREGCEHRHHPGLHERLQDLS